MASEEERSVDDLFGQLPQDGQRALEQIGMGLPELRRIAAREDGMRQVRGILSEFATAPDPRRPGDDEGPAQRAAVWPWVRLLLVAAASVFTCLLSSLFIGKAAALVGLALALLVFWVAFRTRSSHGGVVARWLTLAAYLILVSVGSYFANAWYLQVRGEEQTVTIASPTHQWTHGTRETYCRVQLNDGSVHEVISNKENCADRVGQKVLAVVDPAGHYEPSLGTKSDIGGVLEGYVCLGAAAVLVLAPVTAAMTGRAKEARSAA
ncbi:MAG: hypothetical protein HOY79_38260 [Streptomyces sp.]|nr:hypothetical protein [Streptomyces sp.]